MFMFLVFNEKYVYWDDSHSSWIRCYQFCFLLKEHPSVSLAFLPMVLTEDSGAANTEDYRMFMAKDHGDFIASWALHLHKVGIGLCARCFFLCFLFFSSGEGWRRSFARGTFSSGGYHLRKKQKVVIFDIGVFLLFNINKFPLKLDFYFVGCFFSLDF